MLLSRRKSTELDTFGAESRRLRRKNGRSEENGKNRIQLIGIIEKRKYRKLKRMIGQINDVENGKWEK